MFSSARVLHAPMPSLMWLQPALEMLFQLMST
jgi:hypothetical protein